MCWCFSSSSFLELRLSQELLVGVVPVVHLRSCNYLRKRVLVWEQWFISASAIISGNMCLCGSSKSFPELPLSQDIFVDVGVVVHSRSTYSQELNIDV
jgi:hypothetical protein